MANDRSPAVALQALETAKALQWPSWQMSTLAVVSSSRLKGVQEIGQQLLHEPRKFDGAVFAPEQIKLLAKGQEIYQQLCFACHGADGHGMTMDGLPAGTTLAPRLAGSHTVLAPHESLVAVLLHGAIGPINGKTYDSLMPPQGTNNDEWIAAVASYVRNSFGNNASVVLPGEVAAVRAATKERGSPWTLDELQAVVPQPLPNRQQWRVTASDGADSAALALDGKNDTRYSSGAPQHPGQWYQIELPAETLIAGVTMDCGNASDYPRGYKVETSLDGSQWVAAVASGRGTGTLTQISFPPVKARFVRITQTAGAKDRPWSIAELQVLAAPKLTASTILAKNTQP